MIVYTPLLEAIHDDLLMEGSSIPLLTRARFGFNRNLARIRRHPAVNKARNAYYKGVVTADQHPLGHAIIHSGNAIAKSAPYGPHAALNKGASVFSDKLITGYIQRAMERYGRRV